VALGCVQRKGGGCLWIRGLGREENVGEVGVPILCLDVLFEVDDGHPVDVEKGHSQVSMMQSMTFSMLFVSGAWSQVAEESMANRMTMKRRVIWGRVQTRPSVRRRVRVCKSAVEKTSI
jgi:hypothetical protein